MNQYITPSPAQPSSDLYVGYSEHFSLYKYSLHSAKIHTFFSFILFRALSLSNQYHSLKIQSSMASSTEKRKILEQVEHEAAKKTKVLVEDDHEAAKESKPTERVVLNPADCNLGIFFFFLVTLFCSIGF